MTDLQKAEIKKLRTKGLSYGKIASALNLPQNTVKSYCRRNPVSGITNDVSRVNQSTQKDSCLNCGTAIHQIQGRKKKKFCSDSCRMKWWNSNLDKVNRKAIYTFICPHCGKEFTVYGNVHRKYCSHDCYIADRFGENNGE